jgi:hypothetical protein
MTANKLRRNILAWVALATPDEVSAGLAWYPDALAFCREVGRETGYAADVVAAVVAVLSSQTSWPENKANARKVIAWHQAGRTGRPPGCPGYGENFRKARRILRAADAGEPIRACASRALSSKGTGRIVACNGDHCGRAHVHGPKHAPFYWSIIGDPDTPTVDVWATRVATIHPSEVATLAPDDPRRKGLPGKLGDDIRDAYRAVAAAQDILPVQAQAIPWGTIQTPWKRADGAANGRRDDALVAERARTWLDDIPF